MKTDSLRGVVEEIVHANKDPQPTEVAVVSYWVRNVCTNEGRCGICGGEFLLGHENSRDCLWAVARRWLKSPVTPDDFYPRLMLATEASVQHHSWVHRYVSSYHATFFTIAELEISMIKAFLEARVAGTSRTVDQNGEMQLQVCPNGRVRLMLPWKEFEMEVETSTGRRRLCELPQEDVRAYLTVLQERLVRRIVKEHADG